MSGHLDSGIRAESVDIRDSKSVYIRLPSQLIFGLIPHEEGHCRAPVTGALRRAPQPSHSNMD